MALSHTDFTLTASELTKINTYIESRARIHAEAGEDAATSVCVVFNFIVPTGRELGVVFDGALHQFWLSDMPDA